LPQVEENEPALVEARTSWPVEGNAVAIETASLPALAGDPASDPAVIAAAGEDETQSSGAIETARVDVEHPYQIGEAPATEETGRAAPPTAESEQGVPYVSETERVLETVSAAPEPAPAQEPPHPVQTVSEKPANPRRGWWQRLMQS
jgi:hypothetical protein